MFSSQKSILCHLIGNSLKQLSAVANERHYANRVGSDEKKKIIGTLFARGDKADDYSRFTRALIQQQRRSESTAASVSV